MEIKFLTNQEDGRLILDLKTEDSVDMMALRYFKENGDAVRILGTDFPISTKEQKPAPAKKLEVKKDKSKSEKPVEQKPEEFNFYEDRDALKERLDEMGVDYNNRLRLPALQELYDKHSSAVVEPPEDTGAEQEAAREKAGATSEDGEDPLAFLNDEPEEQDATIEDVRESLIKLTKEKGPKIAMGVLQKAGAKNVSSLDQGKYSVVIKAAEALL